jgi:hypothetical protein
MVNVGFRVYRKTDKQYFKDARGTFDGWSAKFDEWLPAYSVRILPYGKKSGKKGMTQEVEIDEDGDELIEPEAGQTRVYSVPRNFQCTSSAYIKLMNDFGNEGCFELLVQLLESEEFCKDINVKALMCISILISLPAVTYHKTFMEEFGGRINQAIKARLIGIQDKHVRDIKKTHVETLYKSLAALQLRTMEKAMSLKDLEIFKLNMCKKYLRSENLEPRIQGMRELKDIIDNNQSWSPNRQLTFQFLVEWMAENNVFELLWGKRTHQ